jgi:hypothetical protein
MASMLSLLDVLPRHEQLVMGVDPETNQPKATKLFGISGEDIGEILRRYPDAFQQIADSGGQPIKMHPGLLGALLAGGQRNADNTKSFLGDELMEGRCRTLDAATQMRALDIVGRCTFPDGIGPFLEGLVSLSEATLRVMEQVVQVASRVPVTASPPTPRRSEPQPAPASGS